MFSSESIGIRIKCRLFQRCFVANDPFLLQEMNAWTLTGGSTDSLFPSGGHNFFGRISHSWGYRFQRKTHKKFWKVLANFDLLWIEILKRNKFSKNHENWSATLKNQCLAFWKWFRWPRKTRKRLLIKSKQSVSCSMEISCVGKFSIGRVVSSMFSEGYCGRGFEVVVHRIGNGFVLEML